jgi:exosome complex component CSL4
MSDNATFPGDKIASIEEYEAGYNTFDDGDMVRAATVGQKDINKTTRIVSINHPKMISIPKVGDIIIINSKSWRYNYWNSCSSNVIYDCSFN